ncbi:MAG: hypothetical protein JJ992_26460, partial [Planctomycetes bacterium]|nr:hypothetical protein [Planctomycetota bacterium]
SFHDDTVDVTLRLATLHADQRDRAGMEVTAHFRLVLKDGRLALQHEGDFQIYPLGFVPGEQRLSGPQLVARQILRRKLEASVPREIDLTDPFGSTADSTWAYDRFFIRDGWLVVFLSATTPRT